MSMGIRQHCQREGDPVVRRFHGVHGLEVQTKMSMQMISRRLATTLIAAFFLLLIPASVMADEFGGTWVSASAN